MGYSSLILAAEDCDPSEFDAFHNFSSTEEKLITKLKAHGPVLLRGGRGSGKSALMIEASRKLAPNTPTATAYGIYVSLRHLTLLRSTDKAYEKYLCEILISAIRSTFASSNLSLPDDMLNSVTTASELQQELAKLSTKLGKRIVIFFDDAAHIGREASLGDFFDIYRTISSSTVSCKASIYPGVTKFGTRFDVLNDATVLDLTRNEEFHDFESSFLEVMKLRFSKEFPDDKFNDNLPKSKVARALGQAVLGNMRAFIFACNILSEQSTTKIGYPELGKTLIDLAQNYYWPLLEEIKPKLGSYMPLIETSEHIATELNRACAKKNGTKSVLIFRETLDRLSKGFEILEYSGFISKREASRAMRSGGRGARFAINLCTLLEKIHGARLTTEVLDKWISKDEPVEFHRNSQLSTIVMPQPSENVDLKVLDLSITALKKSPTYPYGLTEAKIKLLKENGIDTIGKLAGTSDGELSNIHGIGDATLAKLKNLVGQAIWM